MKGRSGRVCCKFLREDPTPFEKQGACDIQDCLSNNHRDGRICERPCIQSEQDEGIQWCVAGEIEGVGIDYRRDNRCNDGVHYGRAPSKSKWRDGEIGHQYFVDLMSPQCHLQ